MSLRESVKRQAGRRAGRPWGDKHGVMELALLQLPTSQTPASTADTGARLSSPGHAENIAGAKEGRLCVGEL